ncbi:nuclear transport factor 2 family protein [Luteibacter aegosomatis]|uniref:nuclear transport factor 2 family protein n=1 Tax=Luteibacter aegosomatis TaxID=2911537 RepID=UPI001FF89C0B|nr:nuclear transport factor 2 family protein [Luteibacter aegosomatis]UPG87666.1 nuclear transport factor 2 family protein [Luteibacter aegosomatis]
MFTRLFVAAAILTAGPAHAATDDADVLAPVHAFFGGMATYDQAAMRATVQPEGSVALLRKGKVVRRTLGEFIDGIKPGKDRIEERIYDPLVRVDDDLAVVWTRYDFRVNGQVKHCGTDLIHLVKMEGKWVIAGVADNSRDTCPG